MTKGLDKVKLKETYDSLEELTRSSGRLNRKGFNLASVYFHYLKNANGDQLTLDNCRDYLEVLVTLGRAEKKISEFGPYYRARIKDRIEKRL